MTSPLTAHSSRETPQVWHYTRWATMSSVFLVIAIAFWAGLRYGRSPVLHGFTMQPPKPALDFTLTSHTGAPVSLHDFRGKLVLLYFGYTFCPGICPTTLANVAQALHQLGPQAQQVQLLMISVDPERDTPERLAAYVPAFHRSFIGLTGSPAEIATVAPKFGIFYEKEDNAPATGYLVNHSSTMLVIDQQGIMRFIIPFNTSVPDIMTDIAAWLRQGASS